MRFYFQLSMTIVSTCLLLTGCGNQPSAPLVTPTPKAVVAFPSSVQLAAGSTAQLQAQVNDQHDQPIGGALIVFSSKDPRILGVTQDGVISALGPIGVSAVRIASGVRIVEVPVRIGAGGAAQLEAIQGSEGVPSNGAQIRDVVVRLRDQFNNPVSGAALIWTLDEQGGSIESASATTAADGTGTARWLVAATIGHQTLEVHSGDVPPLVLNAQVTAGPAAAIQLRSDPLLEPGMSAESGDIIQIRAQVADQHGIGVTGIEVGLETSGACKVEPALQKTDDTGSTPAYSLQIAGQGECMISATTSHRPTLHAKLTVPVTSTASHP